MKLRTANTLRSIDRWIERFRSRNLNFHVGLFVVFSGLASSRRYLLALPPLLVFLALHFAVLQFVALILVGFFLGKLYSFRMANALLAKRTR